MSSRRAKSEPIQKPDGFEPVDSMTEAEVTEARTKQVREEIRKSLSRVALTLTINDDGIAGFIDAGCKIDRAKIVLEEMKALTERLEKQYEDFVQETVRDVDAEARNAGVRGV